MRQGDVAHTLSQYISETGGVDRFGVNLVLLGDQMGRLEAALAAGCRVVSFLRGDPSPYVRRAKAAGAIVFWTVSGPTEAKKAAEEGVDFIVAQGREAGGHLTGEAPLMTILPAVVDASQGVPVVAAGGIAEGRGLAAALALGACGAWMGTRFIASVESGCHPGHKRKVVESGISDLVETTLFDGGWPNSPHRVIANSTFKVWEAAGCPPSGSRPGEGDQIGTLPGGTPLLRYNVASPWADMDGDWEAGPLYAGTTCALIKDIEPVSLIVERISSEAADVLRKSAGYEGQ
jgi:nitronate monooxygenase